MYYSVKILLLGECLFCNEYKLLFIWLTTPAETQEKCKAKQVKYEDDDETGTDVEEKENSKPGEQKRSTQVCTP